LTSPIPTLRLVEIWNKLSGVKPVSKFTNRSIAIRRLWAAIQALAPQSRTKIELVMGLINRTSGATLAEIMAATGWQAHTVRGFIWRPAQIAAFFKGLGVKVESFKREGERVYRVR
jgi:hypothetical protein